MSSWKQALDTVNADNDNLELWENLIVAIDSSPAIATEAKAVREVYDRLLTKFPLLFGYWLKYVQLEKDIYKSDERIIYERAICAFPNSLELWSAYLTSINSTLADSDDKIVKTRVMFERAIARCGAQFLSHDLWDKYLEFENSIQQGSIEYVQLLSRVVRYPLHQYSRYYQQYQAAIADFAQFEPINEEEFSKMEKLVTKRYTFESEIRRTYFHTAELELEDVDLWNDYLDFVEQECDKETAKTVYEQCLVPCALYDVFWLRYVRWSIKNNEDGEQEEETRNIYRRACYSHVPTSRMWIRIHWSIFEESVGNIDLARDILNSLQHSTSYLSRKYHHHHPSTHGFDTALMNDIALQRVHFERRVTGDALGYINKCSNSAVLQAIMAPLSADPSSVWDKSWELGKSNPFYVVNYFEWALDNTEDKGHDAWRRIVSGAAVAPTLLGDISRQYLDILERSADTNAMHKYMEVDMVVNYTGFAAPRESIKLQRENGHPGVELDPIELKYSAAYRENPGKIFEPLYREQGIKTRK